MNNLKTCDWIFSISTHILLIILIPAFYFDDPSKLVDRKMNRYTVGVSVRGDVIEEYKDLLVPKGYSVVELPSTTVVKNEIPFVTHLSHYCKHRRYTGLIKLIRKLKIKINKNAAAFEVYDKCKFWCGGKVEMRIAFGENSEKYCISKYEKPALKE